MTPLKNILSFLALLISFVAPSQTFVLNAPNYIGKTQKQISKINKTANTKQFHKEKVGRIVSIIYDDSLNSATHHFVFARRFPFGPRKCFSYFVTIDKAQFDKAKADLLARCEEQLSDMSAVQVSGSKKYIWHFNGLDKASFCSMFIEEYTNKYNCR